jgi:hypothetical protein
MSKKEVLLVVSRGFALLLCTWGFVELTYLPERLFSLSHHLGQQSALSIGADYWGTYYSLATALLLLRVTVLLIAAIAFWKCGPRVQALFGWPDGTDN